MFFNFLTECMIFKIKSKRNKTIFWMKKKSFYFLLVSEHKFDGYLPWRLRWGSRVFFTNFFILWDSPGSLTGVEYFSLYELMLILLLSLLLPYSNERLIFVGGDLLLLSVVLCKCLRVSTKLSLAMLLNSLSSPKLILFSIQR